MSCLHELVRSCELFSWRLYGLYGKWFLFVTQLLINNRTATSHNVRQEDMVCCSNQHHAWACVFCCYAFSRLIHQTIASRIPGAPTSAICLCSVPRSLSCRVWRLLQCSDTFRLLADCPATAVFGLVMAIPALLFLACLHIKFTRVHLHVLRTHLQRCRHLLRSVLTHFRQPVVTSPSSERKTRKCSCEAKNRTAASGRCLGLKPPLPQTTKKARIGHPWRDQTPSCSPSFFNPGKGRC